VKASKRYRERPPRFKPVGVVDIGSNSVRLVMYDGVRRAPAPVFNEKVLCGLGRGLAATGSLSEQGVVRALAALARFRALSRAISADKIFAVATAAAREASNGREFISAAEAALGHRIQVLSGKQEARLAALGVLGAIPDAEGGVGDLGGGSLELTVVRDAEMFDGVTLPLGPLKLIDQSGGDIGLARQIIDEALSGVGLLRDITDNRLYAVGGAWRNIARLHMSQQQYPLHSIHHYEIGRDAAQVLTSLVSGLSPASLNGMSAVSSNRAETLPMGALVLERLLERARPRSVVFSAWGLREGLLHSKLPKKKRQRDPLMSACWDFARRHSRSPAHELELCDWTDAFFASKSFAETECERHLRHAACMLADIGWRTPPDYRGDRSYNIISQATFVGIDHPSRVFLAMCVYFRYEGVTAKAGKELRNLLRDGMLSRAQVLAATLRLAYVLSAAMPGLLPRIGLKISRRNVILTLPVKLKDLQGEAVDKRLSQLADLLGYGWKIVIATDPES
jgi:exopolyphosphatase/guanosine-5'-triphosphate,3'-diphosphate pyrophosphatase